MSYSYLTYNILNFVYRLSIPPKVESDNRRIESDNGTGPFYIPRRDLSDAMRVFNNDHFSCISLGREIQSPSIEATSLVIASLIANASWCLGREEAEVEIESKTIAIETRWMENLPITVAEVIFKSPWRFGRKLSLRAGLQQEIL
jgi:hypothetical protein